jgi:two-component system nitrogen regulation response regulator NtrX
LTSGHVHGVLHAPPAGGTRATPSAVELPGTQLATSLTDELDAYERTLILRALSAANGNITAAAKRLQTDRPNLYRRMRRLGIETGAMPSAGHDD